jgi:hypothetical protein
LKDGNQVRENTPNGIADLSLGGTPPQAIDQFDARGGDE